MTVTLVALEYFELLERPSTSIANHDIVIMCNTKTKAEMQAMIELMLLERDIDPTRTKIGQNIICRIGDPKNTTDLIRVGAHNASSILIQVLHIPCFLVYYPYI